MKSSIKIILFSLAIAMTNTSLAQKHHRANPEEMIGQQMEKIEQILQLDDLQAVIVKNTLVKYAKARLTARQSSKKPQIVRAKMIEIKRREQNDLSKILDKEQLKKLKEYQNNLKDNRRIEYDNKMDSRY